MKAGLTLVEVLIAAALGTIVLAAAWSLFHVGDRSRSATASARALQTAMLIQEHVTNDLSRMVPLGVPFRFDPKKTDQIGFYVIDPAETAAREIGVRAVGYRLPGKDEHLLREYAAEEAPVGPSPLTTIAFLPYQGATGPMVRVRLAVGRTRDDPPGPPVPHTFLVRPANPRATPGLAFRALSGFVRDAAPTADPPRLPEVW